MTHSLHRRITLGLTGFAAALLLALILLEGFFIQRVAEYYVSTRLEHDSETLLAALTPTPDNRYQLDDARVHPIYQRPFSGHYFRISLPGQTLRSRSLWDETLRTTDSDTNDGVPPSHDLPPSHYPSLTTIQGPQQQPLLVYQQRYEINGQQVIVTTAESLADLTPLVRQAQLWSAVTATTLILLFVLLQYRWMSASLSPLQRLREQLEELQQGKRDQLNLPQTFAELEPLTGQLNQLLTALDQRISRSRNAMGNLAHALKTPLAELQQLCSEDLSGSPELTYKLASQLALINERIDSELKRARIAGAQGKRRQLCVRDEVMDLTDTLNKIYGAKDIQLNIQIAPEIMIAFDRQDFLEMTGNLLDNAYKWASRRIRIAASLNKGFHLTIEDDGPGCDEPETRILTERGTRLDEFTQGHGLGLSIVKEIVTQYEGQLHFGRSELGGLLVDIYLPG